MSGRVLCYCDTMNVQVKEMSLEVQHVVLSNFSCN